MGMPKACASRSTVAFGGIVLPSSIWLTALVLMPTRLASSACVICCFVRSILIACPKSILYIMFCYSSFWRVS